MPADLERMLQDLSAHARDVADVLGRDHLDPKVIEAIRAIPRERFVKGRRRDRAYGDHPISIGHGQTISQPFIVAFMTDLLGLERSHNVLEIGAGSGYQTAILAKLAGEVHSLEIVPELADQARRNLEPFGFDNVHIHTRDGQLGLPDQAPYDRIICAAASPELPPAWRDQLAPQGRILTPIGSRFGVQYLKLFDKRGDGTFAERETIPVAFVPLTGRH